LWKKSPPVNVCQMNSEQILSVLGYWWCIYDLVVMLKISSGQTIQKGWQFSNGRPNSVIQNM
jgi:hypothetical protein